MAWLYPLVPGFKTILDQLPDWAQVAAIALAINWLLAIIPIFQHLWFLYYLVLLITGYAVVTWVARKLNWNPLPAWIVDSPLRLIWLVPLTFVPQFFMVTDFGPDTAASPSLGLPCWRTMRSSLALARYATVKKHSRIVSVAVGRCTCCSPSQHYC